MRKCKIMSTAIFHWRLNIYLVTSGKSYNNTNSDYNNTNKSDIQKAKLQQPKPFELQKNSINMFNVVVGGGVIVAFVVGVGGCGGGVHRGVGCVVF